MSDSFRILGVALDMDGLLFDTEPLYHRAADVLLHRRGHRYEDAVRRQMMGQPGPRAIQIMLDYYGLTDSWESVLAEADQIFEELLGAGASPLPGLFDLLDHLDALRLPYAVATSSRRRYAERILTGGNVAHRMQFLLAAEDVVHGKPAPDIYLLAARRLGIPAEQMLVLEDSENGCLAAVAATAITVAVPGPHSIEHCFDGAHLIASSLADPRLRELIDQYGRT